MPKDISFKRDFDTINNYQERTVTDGLSLDMLGNDKFVVVYTSNYQGPSYDNNYGPAIDNIYATT